MLHWCQSGNRTLNAKSDQQLAGLFKELWLEECSPEGCIRISKTQTRSYGNSVLKRNFLLRNDRTWVRILGWVPVQVRIPLVLLRTFSRAEFAERRVEPHWQCLLFLSTNTRPETKMKICVAFQNYADCLCVQLYENELFKEQKCQLYLPGVAVWTRVYWCKRVNTGWFLPLIWPSPVKPLLVRGIEPEPEPKRLSFLSIMPYNPHLSRNRGGIRPPVSSQTEASFHGDSTSTPGPERTSLW